MKRTVFVLGGATVCALAAVPVVLAADPTPAGMVNPTYNAQGDLVRPDNFRNWIFVGASLGLSYDDGATQEGPGLFHHVYMQPEAYAHYKETGAFAEKTMLVMENYSAGQKVDPNLHGHFEDARVGVEVALKDKEKFPDGWAYFNFSTRAGLKETAKAFPKAMCYDCHNQHGADDNVFVQFYPVLKDIMKEQGRWKDIGEAKVAGGSKK